MWSVTLWKKTSNYIFYHNDTFIDIMYKNKLNHLNIIMIVFRLNPKEPTVNNLVNKSYEDTIIENMNIMKRLDNL